MKYTLTINQKNEILLEFITIYIDLVERKVWITDKISNTTNKSKVCSGIVKPIKVQLTSAHDPDPLRVFLMTSKNGNVSNIKYISGPHSGTWSLGKFCNHICRDAKLIPIKHNNIDIIPYSFLKNDRGLCINAIKKITPNAVMTTRSNMHSGQGSR